MIIHCDGGSRGNPGHAAIGVVFFDNEGKIIKKHKEYIGMATNNEAEYRAVITAMKLANEKILSIYMDSEVVAKQLSGEYKVKATNLKPLYDEAKKMEKRFTIVKYNLIPRLNSRQKIADMLVNKALDEHSKGNVKI
ncbi:MAG: ribonuclease HI family protein [Candidatus Woesearchaeota archaeon]